MCEKEILYFLLCDFSAVFDSRVWRQMRVQTFSLRFWSLFPPHNRPVNAYNCHPICQQGQSRRHRPHPQQPPSPPRPVTCLGSPDVESSTGLVKMSPPNVPKARYEAPIGHGLTYICRDGKVIEKTAGVRSITIKCTKDGRYLLPKQWPRCH